MASSGTEGLFKIEAEEVAAMMEKCGYSSVLQLLESLVKSTKKMARPPISNFYVGAVGLGAKSGRIYMGVNLEFPGLPLHNSVHAEQFVVANAFLDSKDETRISYIAVSDAPCGHCRQFLQEIRSSSDIGILITGEEEESGKSFQPLSYFLPQEFGPDDLLPEGAPLLLEPHQNHLVLDGSSSCYNGGGADGAVCSSSSEDLKKAALEAANKAHAPYSNCPSGVALMGTDGRVFAGSYIESAAHNPSLPPLQAALVAFVAQGGGAYEDIVAAVLVEKKGAAVGQESNARLLLRTISPNSTFHAFYCQVIN